MRKIRRTRMAYGYSRFCERYKAWRGRLDVVLRQVYRAGSRIASATAYSRANGSWCPST